MTKKFIFGLLKKILIILLPVIIIVVIVVVGGGYILTIIDETWDRNENSPRSYRNGTTVTKNGIETDIMSILEDALRNEGYPDSEIEKIKTDLENSGYSGEEFKKRFIEKAIEMLGLQKVFTDVENINVIELVWELNKEVYSKYLDKYEQLEYLMNAELVTQMPYLEHLKNTNKLNGRIFFDRYLNGDTQATRLKYIEEEQFDKLLEENDAEILKYFTMTESNDIEIAYYLEENVKVETNDTTVDISEYDDRVTNENPTFVSAGYETKIIPYKTMIPAKYNLPFEYMWALLVMIEDYDFVEGLAKLAYDSEIIISIYDNVTEDTTITNYTYSRQTKQYEQVTGKQEITTSEVPSSELNKMPGYTPVGGATTTETKGPMQSMSTEARHIGSETPEDYYVKKTVYTYTNTLEVKLTYADVWAIRYSTEYEYFTDGHKIEDGTPDSTETTTQGEDTETEVENSRENKELNVETTNVKHNTINMSFRNTTTGNVINVPVNEEVVTTMHYMGETWSTLCTSAITVKEERYTYSKIYVNNPDSTQIHEKTNPQGEFDSAGFKIGENFCSLFRKSNKQEFILQNRSWLMEILSNNPETTDMVDLTKYLLNKATGKEYYRLENFNFEDVFKMTTVGGFYGGSIEEQIWFALLDAGYSKIAAAGVLGNLYAESGVRTNNLEDSAESRLGMTDEQYTESVNNGTYTNFVNDSAGYGLAQWTTAGRKQGLYLFAQSKGVEINDASMQIEYLLGEISPSGGANGYATYQMGTPKRGYSYSSWKDATTIEEATLAFCFVFERPKASDQNFRIPYAQMFYDKYKDATEMSSSVGDVELTGDAKSKMEAMLQEAVRIANDDRYGYSQELRMSEFYYDCSSLVYRLYKKFFGIAMPITTYDYPNYNQYYVGNPTNVQLMPGDVLWRTEHVVIYIGNGNYVAARSGRLPKPRQIEVYQDNPASYTRVYRFVQ